MKNLFNFLKLQALILALGLMTFSCKEDDENPNPDNSGKDNTEYNNQKYTIKNGIFQTGGAMDYFMDETATDKTHYNLNLFMTDGTPVIKDGDIESLPDGKLVIVTALLSPGTTGFKTGTFEYTSWLEDAMNLDEEAFDAKYRTKYFMPFALVVTDTDGDKDWEEEDGEEVTGGTIKVSGTSPNFTTEYNLTLASGKTVKGSFAGKFNEIQ